jgi:hypothetical protein
MTRPRTTLLVATLAVLALLAGAAIPAAANHDTTDSDASTTDALFGTTDGGEDAGVLTQLQAVRDGISGFAAGSLERARYQYSPFRSAPDDAETSANEMMTAFNERTDSFVDYANARDVSGGEVVAITFEQSGDSETVYLVADYNTTSEAYDSAAMVNSTDRAVDETVTVSGMAADNAADELVAFHDEFVEPGKDPSPKWLSEQWTKYNEDLESSLIDGGDA